MPLRVIIVGAGLGGLGAAVAFTRAGHDVEVFERSSFSNEVGAAIHVAPNASRILKDWGMNFDSLEPVHCTKFNVWNEKEDFVATQTVGSSLRKALNMHDEWLMVHRVDLHNALRMLAERGYGGKKAKIHLSAKVESVDATTAEVTLADGSRHKADLIIGADGVHSRTVNEVAGENQRKISTGQNCFRFLVPIEKMKSNPLTASLMEKARLDACHIFCSPDRRIVMYACRSGKLLNAGAIFPAGSDENLAESSAWLNSGNVDDLLGAYKDFGEGLKAMCGMAEDLKLWSLASRDPPRTFFKDRLALIGDAAHPTLPHQGQGGAQAFEDATALGALFPRDTLPEDVNRRLSLYNDLRYKHTVTILFMSRVGNERRSEVMEELRKYIPDAECPEDMVRYAWDSYPGRDAARMLAAVGMA